MLEGEMERGEGNGIAAPPWSLYVLRCRDGTLYCGIARDVVKRIEQHNRGRGARYTRGRAPVKLVNTWLKENKSAALKAEYAFKALSRSAKDEFLRNSTPLTRMPGFAAMKAKRTIKSKFSPRT